ncbi:MAG: transglutaminase domain-containing protein [Clostridia bacterium]
MARHWHMDGSLGDYGSPALDALRTRAQDAIRARDWALVMEMRPDLKADAGLWGDVWGPAVAVAARQAADPGAMDLLRQLVDDGFRQPEIFGTLLEEAFGADAGWNDLASAMRGAVTTAPVTLLDWPVRRPSAPLGLFELRGRADELRALIPEPSASAWDTALALLKWVTFRWHHANAHMEVDDAVECLKRVDTGLRYACVEYSLVLSQALNAVGIPARRVSLRQEDYHVGLGRGHVVSEAWIDDFGRWVLLDGQNGLYWMGKDGRPLGTADLMRLRHAGAVRPNFFTYRDDLTEEDCELWYTYFAHTTTSAGTWSPGAFVLPFQREWIVTSRQLEHEPDALYPDLSEIGVETALDGGQPALRLSAAHPYASGFAAAGTELSGDVYPIIMTAGEHAVELAVRTPYGTLAGKMLRYRVT